MMLGVMFKKVQMRTKLIILTLALLVWIPFSPIYISVNYGSQPNSPIQSTSSYMYLWLGNNKKIRYFGILGYVDTIIDKTTYLMIRDEKSEIGKIEITNATVKIDQKTFQLDNLNMSSLVIDHGIFNGYAGNGGSGHLVFKLPRIPIKKVELTLKGVSYDIHGVKFPFESTVSSEIIHKSSVISAYEYIFLQLNTT